MSKLLNDKDVGSLLAPVSLGSFALSPMQGSRESFSGIPTIDKSKMWDYALTEDHDKKRILSFLLDNRAINFRLEKPEKEGDPIKAKRLADSESNDFGVGGNATKGRAQIHKAHPSKITGTFQTGKTNTTFDLAKASDNEEDWHVIPRKNPDHSVDTFVSAIMDRHEKKAIDLSGVQNVANNQINTLGSNIQSGQYEVPHAASDALNKLKSLVPSPEKVMYPLSGTDDNGSMLKSVGIAGGIGAGVMGIRNLVQRLLGGQHNSMAGDMLTGGAVGAGASGLYHALGSTAGMTPEDKKIFTDGWKPGVMPKIPSSYSKYPTTLDVMNEAIAHREKIGSDEENLTKTAIPLISQLAELQKVTQENAINPFNPANHIPDSTLLQMTSRIVREPQENDRDFAARALTVAKNVLAKKGEEKVANQVVDLISLQGILGADPSLTPGDRNILLNLARTAMNSSGGQISMGRIGNMGLGMLSGYVLSKVMGFGGAGTIASMAIGGALGNSSGNSPYGAKWNNDGYMSY